MEDLHAGVRIFFFREESQSEEIDNYLSLEKDCVDQAGVLLRHAKSWPIHYKWCANVPSTRRLGYVSELSKLLRDAASRTI